MDSISLSLESSKEQIGGNMLTAPEDQIKTRKRLFSHSQEFLLANLNKLMFALDKTLPQKTNKTKVTVSPEKCKLKPEGTGSYQIFNWQW